MAETAQADLNVSFHADFEQAKRELKTMAGELRKVTSDVDLFEKFVGKLDSALSMAAGGTNTADTTFQKLDSSVNKLTKSIDVLNNKFANFARNSKQAFASTAETKKNLEDTAKGVRDIAAQVNRFNTGNIAAQVQDIFVTAQMNMKPLTIGLQQGTQLLYVLQQSKAPLKEFVVGIKSLFTPLSLVVVALTALVAKIIQVVDWNKVAEKILSGMGFIFKEILSYLPFIGDAAENLGRNFSKMAEEIRNAREEASGFLSILKGFEGIEKELGEREFKLTLEGKTDLEKEEALGRRKVSEAANAQMAKMEKELGRKLTLDEIKDVELAKDAYQARLLYVIKGEDAAKKAAEAEKKRNQELEKAAEAEKKRFEDLQKEIDKITKSYDDIFTKQSDKYENMQFEESIKGLSTYEKTYQTVSRDMAKDVENLKQQAIAAGIPMSKINEMFADSEGKIRAAAEAQAELTVRIEESTKAEEEFNEFVRTAQSETSTFFKDMRHGLRDGQSAWEAFGNAVNNVLDKILDKMIDIGVEAAFSGLGSNTGGKGNSFLGTLFTAGKSLFGGIGGGTQVYNSPIGPTMPGATPLTGAANGGVFSNGVYSSPTLFKFAKGGKFGVMGEAGPEAVMPLHRSPDGSLGVKADGVAGGSPVVVNVINNSNAQARTEQRQTSQGVEIDVMIDEMVAEKLGRNGTASNNALRAYNNRQLVMR